MERGEKTTKAPRRTLAQVQKGCAAITRTTSWGSGQHHPAPPVVKLTVPPLGMLKFEMVLVGRGRDEICAIGDLYAHFLGASHTHQLT